MTPLELVVIAGLWPFGKGDAKDDAGTIKSLEEQRIEVRTDEPIQQSQDKARESYRAFLDMVTDDPRLRAEAMRRLGDLSLEAGEVEQMEAQQLIEQMSYQDAVQLYEALLTSYPDYDKNDSVMYQLARAYENAGEPEKALEVLDRLVADFPDTRHADEAQFRRGEILFVRKSYAEAELAYAKVIAYGESSQFYEQALYKHGWSLFKELRNEDCLDSFFGLLDRKLVDPNDQSKAVSIDQMSRPNRELVEDTLRVISISFSYMGGQDPIGEHLDRRGFPPYSYLAYTSLGDLYLDKERYTDAAETYSAFVDRDPYHDKAPLLQVEVIEAYKTGGFASLVLEGKQAFVERYGIGSEFWVRHQRDDHPVVLTHLKANLTDLAQYHHAEAQKSGSQEAYKLAARWYQGYLDAFPDDPDASTTNFMLAEILFESKQFLEATRQYERTAYDYPPHAKAAEAGYAALLSYGQYEERLERAEKAEWHRDSIESALRFAGTFPTHEKTPLVLTNAAEDLFALSELDLAVRTAGLVITHQPPATPELELVAWKVKAHSHFDLQQFDQAEAAYTRVLALMGTDNPEHQDMVERLASSVYKQGEQQKLAGNTEGAIGHFSRVALVAPTSSIRATAEYDVASELLNMKDWGRAIPALEGFRRANPDHEHAADITRSLAVAYQEASQPMLAAGEFERIAADENESPQVQREALWKAAELYDNSGQTVAAGNVYQRFIQRFPFPVSESMEARQRMVEITRDANDTQGYTYWLNEVVTADAQAGAERTDRTRFLAAKASLVLAQPKRDAFRAVRLVAPLKESLKIKKNVMEEALNAYGGTADYGVKEVTTAATFEIADIYHSFSRELFESERPAGLSAEELEQYDILLEEQAYPFEEKAIEIHQVNVERAGEGVYDEWVIKSYEALAALMPVRYAKAEVGESFVTAIQ